MPKQNVEVFVVEIQNCVLLSTLVTNAQQNVCAPRIYVRAMLVRLKLLFAGLLRIARKNVMLVHVHQNAIQEVQAVQETIQKV